eukprot:Gb_01309 [translate_table: standard]
MKRNLIYGILLFSIFYGSGMPFSIKSSMIAGGIWADKIGGKFVLGFGVIWWSIATMLTPIAARVGLPALLLVRACMGIGEFIYNLSKTDWKSYYGLIQLEVLR